MLIKTTRFCGVDIVCAAHFSRGLFNRGAPRYYFLMALFIQQWNEFKDLPSRFTMRVYTRLMFTLCCTRLSAFPYNFKYYYYTMLSFVDISRSAFTTTTTTSLRTHCSTTHIDLPYNTDCCVLCGRTLQGFCIAYEFHTWTFAVNARTDDILRNEWKSLRSAVEPTETLYISWCTATMIRLRTQSSDHASEGKLDR